MILITGFEPFDGATFNPTQALIERLNAFHHPSVKGLVLPTVYRDAEAAVLDALHNSRPRWVISFGLNSGATALRFEHVALNLNDAAKPDNAGEVRRMQRIRETGPVGYWSGLPFDELTQLAAAHGVTLEPSRDAGGFVCNHVFYSVCDYLARELPESRGGFIHVPLLNEASLEQTVAVVRAWIDHLASS